MFAQRTLARRLGRLLVTMAACFTSSLASAQEVPDTSVVQDLQAQVDQLRLELDALKSAEAGPGPMPMSSITEPVPPCDPCQALLTKTSTYPQVQLTGFFQADAVWFDQDPLNIAAIGDVQDGADFRRTRLAAKGDVWENVGYIIEMDFSAAGRPSFMDVWGEIREGFFGNTVRLGQFRHPFGMDGQTGIRDLVFLERGLPFAFLPFRQIGVMTYGQAANERMTWALSGFRSPTDAYGGNIGDLGGYGMASRLTGLWVDSPQGVLHAGGGYCFIDPSTNNARFRNQPEIFVVETGALGPLLSGIPSDVPAFVDTGDITVENYHLANAELGVTRGPFYAQSEVFYAVVNQSYSTDLRFSGAYCHAAYLLTGEHRPYNRKTGVFGRVDPRCPYNFNSGLGAWEVAGRWSTMDLNNDNISGGRLNNLTLGLNWYLNKYTKLQFNYIRAMLGSSPAVAGPVVSDSAADIYAVRLQIDF